MTGEVRVLLFHMASGPERIAAAYHEVSRRLAGTPGLLGNELMCSVLDPTEFVVISTWTDLSAFQKWEQGEAHRDDTAPLRPYRQSGRAFGVYEVTAAY
ncbi:antibiotic biosynthesis monooxygenase family protein [Actinoplanes siamensis]|uniref:Antibiotic biosynthesis monooxygenase n=1 Tax=Actinoplanes siamensis TaxID=1223317 RepID=A0A919TLX5_9ACTN|nr:antibiotic biosynthesis monooxygenase family protein [Actinoplanes siamensis]GIF07072.1 antibiotic biosynthesis monooxygenase [Actinoplanes siamensis]